ncbi:MAG: PH domain-containing protein [Actinomycetota bacterium]|nr:PH domain-containing protein [Actinomycetota bacterium]
MSRYVEPGEQVRLEARPHGVALARPLSRALLLAVTGGALVYLGSPLSLALGAVGAAEMAAGALVALAEVVRWERTLLVLTSEKLLVVYGVLRRRGAAVRLSRVAPIELEQTLPGRMLGYGTLVAGDLVVPYVPASPELETLLA